MIPKQVMGVRLSHVASCKWFNHGVKSNLILGSCLGCCTYLNKPSVELIIDAFKFVLHLWLELNYIYPTIHTSIPR